MKKALLITLLILTLALSFVSCDAFADRSKPWRDDSGHWHTQWTCADRWEIISVFYTTTYNATTKRTSITPVYVYGWKNECDYE